VTVTDPNVSNLSCTPTVPVANLAPNGTITCTASHTVTQADVDAGSFFNQACVDDGAGGAAQACDDVTTPSSKNPHLTIDKTAAESSYNTVGQVIHYTIVARNDGNTTLTNVLVTDPNASNLSCTPSNPVASLAPNGTINCTASHTVTQADIDNGSFFNAACVDDGPNGAAQACDDVTTPSVKNPHLSILKTAEEANYSTVGQVIHYTIVATNDGNTTLTNVTITDPNAVLGTCTPAIPVASLAPNGTITCTATHTVTQADLTAGHYLNTACVDDGAGGAAQACDDVDVPAVVSKGHIFHTGVTCADYVSQNPSDELASGDYSVKSGKVNQVNPGVMFYYITIQAPSANFTVNVTQSNDKGWKPIPVQATNQVILYEANCSKSSKAVASVTASTQKATLTVTGATAGGTYIVGIKYSLSGLGGQSVSTPFPTVTYSFATNFNSDPVLPGSGDTIVLSPK
jgi:uncharacterized repeat protein (TIGR01451 family)